MQLTMSRDKKQWMEFLRTENDYMTFLLEAFEVPETVESKLNVFGANFYAKSNFLIKSRRVR